MRYVEMLCRIVLGAVAALQLAGPAAAQTRVAGQVVDETGKPVALGRVTIAELGRATVSDTGGRFAFHAVPAGRHRLSAARIGFAPAHLVVDVVDGVGPPAPVTLVLRRSAVTLSGVQVTATPVNRDPLAVTQSTSTVTGPELERSLGATLGATLAKQPGVAARYDGPGANVPIIRGLSGDRILMLQDGQRAGDLASTAPDHGVTIDPSAAARIEIVRGPAALLYGNNALGGVVNVISEDVPTTIPSRIQGATTVSVESATPGGGGNVELTAPVAGRFVVRARAGGRSHQDVRLGDGWPVGRLANTHARNRFGVLGVGAIGERGSAGIAYRGYGFEYGLPSRGGPESWISLHGIRHEVLARAELKAGRIVEGVRADATAQWYEHDELASDGTVATALALRTGSAQAIARTRPWSIFGDGAVGVSGLVRSNGIAGPQALMPANRSVGVGAFLFQEVPLFRVRRAAGAGGTGSDDALSGYVRLPFGVRYDHYAIESETTDRFGAGRRRTFGGVSGSVGVTVPLAQGASLGLNLARAFRSPTVEELFSQAGHAGTGAFEIGDPTLRPEANTGADAVLRVGRRRVTAQIAAYHNRIRDYIALYPTGRDTLAPDGLGGTKSLPLHTASQRTATLRGVEGSVDVAIARRIVVGAIGDVVRASDAASDPLPYIPPARLGTSARYDDGTVVFGIELRHAFAQSRVPAGELRTAAYTLVDAHAGVRLLVGSRLHTLTVRLDNARDVLYRDAASEIKDFAPNPGRNVAAVYRVNF
jgi:iron complex outermembrane recepter protein